jgi:acetate kinase
MTLHVLQHARRSTHEHEYAVLRDKHFAETIKDTQSLYALERRLSHLVDIRSLGGHDLYHVLETISFVKDVCDKLRGFPPRSKNRSADNVA